MGIWNIFGRFATSDEGETIQKVSDTTSVSSNGIVYTTIGPFTHGSDGSEYNQLGCFSSDGNSRMGNTTTGLGAVFIKSQRNEDKGDFSKGLNKQGDDFI